MIIIPRNQYVSQDIKQAQLEVADNRNQDKSCLTLHGFTGHNKTHSVLLARQETDKKRSKIFESIRERFLHDPPMHYCYLMHWLLPLSSQKCRNAI